MMISIVPTRIILLAALAIGPVTGIAYSLLGPFVAATLDAQVHPQYTQPLRLIALYIFVGAAVGLATSLLVAALAILFRAGAKRLTGRAILQELSLLAGCVVGVAIAFVVLFRSDGFSDPAWFIGGFGLLAIASILMLGWFERRRRRRGARDV